MATKAITIDTEELSWEEACEEGKKIRKIIGRISKKNIRSTRQVKTILNFDNLPTMVIIDIKGCDSKTSKEELIEAAKRILFGCVENSKFEVV
jgi:hypothetical protein